MSANGEGLNPLRPYYIPPSIGLAPTPTSAPSTGTHGVGLRNGSAAAYASSARDMFAEIDYSEYLTDSSPSSVDTVKRMLDEALYRYFSVLMAQPFDIAKMILQVKSQSPSFEDIIGEVMSPRGSIQGSKYNGYPYDDSDPDEPAYFTSSAPSAPSTPHLFSPINFERRNGSEKRAQSPSSPKASSKPDRLALKRNDALLEVIAQEWTSEGAWGVWKASNTTFVYGLALQTIESWTSGLLAAIFNVPAPDLIAGSLEVVDSPYPWTSFGVAVAAAVASGMILSPLDIVRTKLMLTPTTMSKRSLMQNLRDLPSYYCPPLLYLPTFLHSAVSPSVKHLTHLLLRSSLGIDPILTPTSYSVGNFLSRFIELFLKLPLETVLRRGQLAVLSSSTYRASSTSNFETVVEVGPYRGVIGTVYSIVTEEGAREEMVVVQRAGRSSKKSKKSEKKGQGFEGLWRGWRVGVWGILGVWGVQALGTGTGRGEF